MISNEYDNFLKKHLFSGRYYSYFYVVDSNGMTVSFGTSEADTAMSFSSVEDTPIYLLWEKIKLSPGLIIEDYKIDGNTNEPAIYIGAPVMQPDGEIAGVTAIELDIEAINSIMFENNPHNGLGESGESYLVGSDFLLRSTSRFQDNSVFKTIVQTDAVKEALGGNTGTAVIRDYRDISVLSSYSMVDIPGLNWAILAEIDEREAMIPIYSIRNNILFLGVLISLFLFAIVYIISIRISLPVIRLKEAAQKITAGNYDVSVDDIVSNDEIGSLVKAFNEMSAKIKEQTGNLTLERTMRLSSMIDGQELERLRLSRELHDGLGQSILAIKMRLERASGVTPEKSKAIMEEVHQLFGNVIQEIRTISNDLMPAELSQFGLTDALRNLCREVEISSGMEIAFRQVNFENYIDEKVNTYLYRISQEALNNIVKHSGAKRASVTLSMDDSFCLDISDDGCGFNYRPDIKLCGNGISNIKERVHLLKGEVEFTSLPGKGTSIKIRIPKGK
ncbi:MAG: histidine kinase [Bacteroidales bacterium]